jgi:hypothetical protein
VNVKVLLLLLLLLPLVLAGHLCRGRVKQAWVALLGWFYVSDWQMRQPQVNKKSTTYYSKVIQA